MSLAPWRDEEWAFDQQKVDEMGQELARQAANMTAAEYRWLWLLGEFDHVGGWAIQGARSCAAWLSFACGVTPMAARERVRVARALPGLPKVCAAFAAGRVSYSKVRAITRVATAENEQLLVTYAETATAAQLEQVVRGYRRVKRLEEAREAQTLFERRSLRWWTDEEGFVRISARLTPEDGAFVIGALERLADSGGEDDPAPAATPRIRVPVEEAEAGRGDEPMITPGWDAPAPAEARRADALRLMAETAAAHGPTASVGGDTHLVVLHADADELRDPSADGDDGDEENLADPATSVGTRIEGVGRVSAETARRLACDAEIGCWPRMRWVGRWASAGSLTRCRTGCGGR
jgi:hypothetical protein